MPVPVILKNEAQLIEVFSSIQGEGMLVGCRQIFVRMAYCNLSCGYCDTPYEPVPNCRIEEVPGFGSFLSRPNPVAMETLYNILYDWQRETVGIHHSISFTGGEPLVQAEVLREWLPVLRKVLPIHLETNGTMPQALEPLLPHLDTIAMDIKAASQSGCVTPWQAHGNFLALARQKDCQVKMVISEETPSREVEAAARMVSEVAPEVPLVLQPLTSAGRISISPPMLLDLQTRAARLHHNVRIIPQTHRFIGLL